MVTRANGSWWYGAHGGADLYQAFGTLYPYPPSSDFNLELERGIEFGAASGLGMHYGAIIEWMEPGSFIGAQITASYDVSNLSGDSRQQFNLDDSEALANFSHFSDFSYIRISPSARYNPWDNGFHLIGGLDINIPISESGLLEQQQQNSAQIHDGLTFNYNSENADNSDVIGQYALIQTNYGLHLGLGWDYLLGDVFGVGRLKVTPYALANVNYGMATGKLSEPFEDLESSLHLANLRVGMQIKFAYDNISYDTLKFDPTYQAPVIVVADLIGEQSVNFGGFLKKTTIAVDELAYVELPKIQEQLREDAIINTERPRKGVTDLADVPQAPKFDIQQNIDKVFSYSRTNQTGLTREMREYLEVVAQYLRDNPNLTLTIKVHTDNSGSRSEKTDRGDKRGATLKKYLTDKGIAERRLFDRNFRDTEPVTSNRTAAGRKKNRRVVIRVTPPRSDRR